MGLGRCLGRRGAVASQSWLEARGLAHGLSTHEQRFVENAIVGEIKILLLAPASTALGAVRHKSFEEKPVWKLQLQTKARK